MNDDPILNKSVFCLIHKKQKVTHICNQLQCHNNPLLCSQCFSDNMHSHYHSNHQNNIQPFVESIEKLSNIIKTHIGPIKKVFKSTLGKSQFAGILEHVQKGSTMFEELQERINVIKNQVQLELDLLMKEFQKTLLVQKQQYFKILDNYQRTFVKNLQFLRSQTEPLMQYQNSLKYYGNKNNMFLKAISETRKKSDWLIKSKKTIMNANKIIQNSYYTNDIIGILSNANKIRFDLLPTWKGQQNIDKGSELKYLIKRALNQWVYIPQIKNLCDQNQNGRNYLPHNPYK